MMATADGAADYRPEVGDKGALFEQQAATYAKYRPVYPEELYAAVVEFGAPALSSPASRQLALDVATGSGQVATVLSDLFAQVVACDSSPGQLAHAQRRPNVRYELAPAERLPAADGSVDLVACAQALHWFDICSFYAEARRVLRPGGTLAVWGYGLPSLAQPAGRRCSPEALRRANELVLGFYSGTLGPYWDDKRLLVENHYKGLEPGPEFFATVERRELALRKQMPLAALIGYLSSWSAYAEYRRRQPDSPDPLESLQQQLMGLLGLRDAQEPDGVLLESPLFLILARAPQAQEAKD